MGMVLVAVEGWEVLHCNGTLMGRGAQGEEWLRFLPTWKDGNAQGRSGFWGQDQDFEFGPIEHKRFLVVKWAAGLMSLGFGGETQAREVTLESPTCGWHSRPRTR